MKYDFKKIESKWQKRWEEKRIFEAKENGKKKKFYTLEMYPYPSGTGLHIGHAFNYIIGDILARFKRMQGFNVLHPMGFDSFGLPAENAAIKNKIDPRKFTDDAIKNYIRQLKMLGISYDWSRTLMSHDPEYYKWNQWIFLKLHDKGLAYKKRAVANWCPSCRTVLANEQAQGGICERCKSKVEIKNLEQWFLKITDYAEELLKDIDILDWPERIKTMQRNWIGKSEGAEIAFEINGKERKIFTTRPDTLFGVTFLVMSAQHPDLSGIVVKEREKEVEKFLKKIKSTKQEDLDKLEKEGVFSGSYAIHPITKSRIPVWIGNFVLAEYGSGIVMGVPAHDERDFNFAQKYELPIKIVIRPENEEIQSVVMDEAYTGSGKLINSQGFNGLFSEEAKEHIVKSLEAKKLGNKKTQYKMRDWLISRQRYWGTPIPMIYCSDCGIQGVKEKDLPVKLPEEVKFGIGNPLETNSKFLNAKCPKCGKKGRRETDTMDTFFDSSWYFLRFTDSKNKKKLFDSKNANYWMPVDFYTGGAEHACMHLIYARFFTKVFRDFGMIKIDEPFKRLFNQGMVHGEDGFVMSKSRGNVIDPLTMADKYGADTLRIFLVSMGSPDSDFSWKSAGIEGTNKFVNKLAEYLSKIKIGKSDAKIQSKINKAIKEITLDIENLQYNLALVKIRRLFEYISEKEIGKKELESFVKILSPFMSHFAEEFWEKINGKEFISMSKWPKFDESKIDEKIEKEEKDVEKLISDAVNVMNIVKEKGKKAKKLFVYVLPTEKEGYVSNLSNIAKRTGLEVAIYSVNEKEKYDPENKSKKVKPGRPGIYLE